MFSSDGDFPQVRVLSLCCMDYTSFPICVWYKVDKLFYEECYSPFYLCLWKLMLCLQVSCYSEGVVEMYLGHDSWIWFNVVYNRQLLFSYRFDWNSHINWWISWCYTYVFNPCSVWVINISRWMSLSYTSFPSGMLLKVFIEFVWSSCTWISSWRVKKWRCHLHNTARQLALMISSFRLFPQSIPYKRLLSLETVVIP